jgi:hypothetical protein
MPFFELLLRLFQGVKAIGAIFSPSYRKKLFKQWEQKPKIVVYEECFGAIIGIVAFVGIIVVMVRIITKN